MNVSEFLTGGFNFSRRRPCRRMHWCACLAAAAVMCAVPFTASAEETKDELIIEKNLFSPERKKWVSATPDQKQGAQAAVKKEINELVLLGTVVGEDNRYAVLRTKKDDGKSGFRPYMQGDYVQGYLLKEIGEKKVVLVDDATGNEYVIYINDEKQERVAEKSDAKPEIKPETPKLPGEQTKEERRAKRKARKMKRPEIPSTAPPEVQKAMQESIERREREYEENRQRELPADLPPAIRKAIENAPDAEAPAPGGPGQGGGPPAGLPEEVRKAMEQSGGQQE